MYGSPPCVVSLWYICLTRPDHPRPLVRYQNEALAAEVSAYEQYYKKVALEADEVPSSGKKSVSSQGRSLGRKKSRKAKGSSTAPATPATLSSEQKVTVITSVLEERQAERKK